MRIIYIILVVFVSGVINSMAQDVKKWNLQECMTYAVKNSPRKNKQNAQNDIYKQSYLEAVGKFLPSLNANVGASFNFGRGLNSNNTYEDINSFSNRYELNSSLVLFDGLANVNRLKMQKMNKIMGKQQLQEIEDVIAYETMEAFFNMLYYKELVKLAEQQLEQSAANLKQVQRMEELGVKGIPDVAEMQAQEAKDNYNLTRQKNLLTISVIQLKEKMNYPIDEKLDIQEYVSEDMVIKSDKTALDIYTESLNYLPKALAAEASLQVQKFSYKMAKGTLFPTLSVGAGYTTDFFRYMDGSEYNSFKDQFKNNRGQYISFSLSIPIFNGFSRSAQVKNSKSGLIIAQNTRDEIRRTLYSEIEQAVADMNGQVDEYYQAKKQAEAMSVAHDVNQRKYKEGLVSALELHTSANRLFESKVEELNAQLKYYLKDRLVDYYRGESFIK